MKKKTAGEFIAEANSVHSGKYDYSKTAYAGGHVKVCIVCPAHGEFWQDPANHLRGAGCRKCAAAELSATRRKETALFIKEADKIHNGRYDYFEVNYINSKTKVRIICPEHGGFWQAPGSHLAGCGCPRCSSEQNAADSVLPKEIFIKRATEIHGGKYSYSEVDYTSLHDKVRIKCPLHGYFTQAASNHLRGAGCPCCFRYSKGEELVKSALRGVPHKIHWSFPGLYDKSPSHPLSFDFYIPQQNLLIECNGIQHYRPQEFLGGYRKFLVQKHHDWLKRRYARKNGYTLVAISYRDYQPKKIREILSPYLPGVEGHVDGLP